MKYGWACVFNIDETSVRVYNGSVLTIGKISSFDISVDGKRDDMECFTAIATCTTEKTYQLILLNKDEQSKRFESNLRVGECTLVLIGNILLLDVYCNGPDNSCHWRQKDNFFDRTTATYFKYSVCLILFFFFPYFDKRCSFATGLGL